MFFELFLGLRYLKAKRRQNFFSIITVIAIAGVMVGVMALIIVLSVMNGFQADLMSKMLAVYPHIKISSNNENINNYKEILDKIDSVPGIEAAAPAIYKEVMLNSGYSRGALLRGIDPENTADVIDIKSMIKNGSLPALRENTEGFPAIIIGSDLAAQLGVFPGDIVKVMSPEGRMTPIGRISSTRSFRVSGIFDSGMYDYDTIMAFVSLEEAQKLLGLRSRVNRIEVRVTDPYNSGNITALLKNKLGEDCLIQDWREDNRSILEALLLEKYAMFVILTMIVLVGALNIISTLVMTVIDKSKDIAILRAMGATRKSILSVFIIQGVFAGVTGTIAGICSGLGICFLLSKYKFIELPSDIYYITKLPVNVDPFDVLTVMTAALLISFLATVYPSWHASRLNPVETLRYE